jgi:Phage integrase, N-terminal SAM-like domain
MASVFFRKNKKGRKIWWINYTDLEGVRRRKPIGPTERVALEVLADIEGKKARREFLGVVEDSEIRFADLAERWWSLVKHTLAPTTQTRWRAILDGHLKPAFNGYLRSITASAVQTYVAKRTEAGAAASTVNQETCCLKLLIRHAVEEKYLSRNPFLTNQGEPLKSMKPRKEPPGRIRFLTPEELDRLLAAMDGILVPPSVHPSGNQQRYEKKRSFELDAHQRRLAKPDRQRRYD